MRKNANKKPIAIGTTLSIILVATVSAWQSDLRPLVAQAKITFNCDDYADEEAKKQCEESQDKARDYAEIIEKKEKQAAALSSQLNTINQQQAINQSSLQSTKQKVAELEESIDRLNEEIASNEDLINAQKKILSGLIQSYYEYDQQGTLGVIMASDDFSDFFSQTDSIENSGTKVREILNTITEARQQLMSDKEEAAEKKDEHDKTKDALEEKGLALQTTENQKQELLGQTQAEKEKYEQLLNDVRDEIYSLESEKSVDYGKIPASKDGYFDYPVSKAVISQSYGCLQNAFAKKSYPSCNGGKGGFHNGLDFSSGSGLNIFAVRDGKVIGSGNNGKYAYGQWIAIDHGDGLVTLYGHLSKKYVSKGDKVDQGDKIGIMGTTGYSTGVHLHFSVFDADTFETTESKYVDGLMIPTGASVNPNRYF